MNEPAKAGAMEIDEAALDAGFEALAAQAGDDSPDAITENLADSQAIITREEGEKEYNDLLTMLIGPGFNILAPDEPNQEEKTAALAGAWSPVLQKYWPDGPGAFGPEIGAAVTTLIILGPIFFKAKKPLPPVGPVENVEPSSPVKSGPVSGDAPVAADVMAGADG